MNKQDITRLQDSVDRMNDVNALLNNPEYQKAFISIKAHVLNAFENLKHDEVEEMQESNRILKTLNRIEKHFNTIVNDGKVAEKKLDKLIKGE